ncbi:response regulator FixJ [Phycisphaerales bacterium AB-hyl4]|uniref:Response regulator FixJ n=1 Tax=Natronomicrosphaera hydrolytica TaxID=3242702 RepID=A0ABV4U6A1_9BACT
MTKQTTVFIVDDDKAVRDSLAWLVESAGVRVEAFDRADHLLERLDEMDRLPFGCIVADIRLPGMSGLDLQDRLREMGVRLPFVVITGHGDVPLAVRAMKAGAVDFIEKPFSDRKLLDRIQHALKHDEKRRLESASKQLLKRRIARLTARERQVMEMVVQGRLNKQVAASLDLSPKTVEVHRAHVMEKMEAGSLAELVRMAVQLEGATETSNV